MERLQPPERVEVEPTLYVVYCDEPGCHWEIPHPIERSAGIRAAQGHNILTDHCPTLEPVDAQKQIDMSA